MNTPSLKLSKQDRVAWITLHRPAALNALTDELVVELGRHATELGRDPEVRAVVLSGSGGNFCSGLDLKKALPATLTTEQASSRIALFQAAIQSIIDAPKPFIACVQGAAVGFGADLALACDLRVFGESGYLQEKFVDIGLMPDGGGTFWLPRLVGLGRALELMMLGTRVDARAALALGLANRVVVDSDVSRSSAQLAGDLAKKAPLALAAIKAAARQSLSGTPGEALERERDGQARLLASADFREGVQAWTERRAPEFRGK